ncbi:neuropilin and tolloid-like protein 2, partial [Orussus abietinus]|uniref:neuropilin and tolloid-like protein 2 n=1 Tax=Orussus abietinus TaxID=222816 RepID=UPI000626197E
DKFKIGDEAKREFYSPNYPDNYPSNVDCVRVLKAERGMLLKLDFRDRFHLEDYKDERKEECYDYLEVRDGQHGYSDSLGMFCGNGFPRELTSNSRFLWLRFHSDDTIEYGGFKAIWNTIPRPTDSGVPPEVEPCVVNVTGVESKILSKDVEARKKQAEKDGVFLECIWVITVKPGWKIQLSYVVFKLEIPNECESNVVEVFGERTDLTSRIKSFCGSIADTVVTKSNIMHVRYHAQPKALNSTFEFLMTAFREKDSGEKMCAEDEYDCEDTTCIDADLKCNHNVNCRFRWDEDENTCGGKNGSLIDSEHIVIILVVFSLILFGLCFAFLFNCVRKLVRDHRIIQEHIRQSRENRLDELGRKGTPCPISTSRTDIADRSSESPSLEVVPSKELLPPSTRIAHEYTKDLVLEMNYGTKDIHDIHQSNNVSNATQERLQESSEEPEMRDSSCQTRESLFETRSSDSTTVPVFTTFGYRSGSTQNGALSNGPSPGQSQKSSRQSSQPHQQRLQKSHPGSQCSGCSPASRGRDGSTGSCPRHDPIPAPPGWSSHDPPYSQILPSEYHEEPPDYPSYQRFQSPKPTGERFASPRITRQTTMGSGERYGSSIYGSGHGTSSNATSGSQHSSTPKCPSGETRYRAEAVIEVDQRRPFSIESTKSAPDVIATH